MLRRASSNLSKNSSLFFSQFGSQSNSQVNAQATSKAINSSIIIAPADSANHNAIEAAKKSAPKQTKLNSGDCDVPNPYDLEFDHVSRASHAP